MPLYEFRCPDGHATERVTSHVVSGRRCECGKWAKRILSTFAIKTYRVDRSNFAAIAPRNAEGKPMTLAEVQRSGKFDKYLPGEEARERSRLDEQADRKERSILESAKREAWREVSNKWKVRVP